MFSEMDYSKIETMWFEIKNISSSTSGCTYDQVKHLEKQCLVRKGGLKFGWLWNISVQIRWMLIIILI